MGETFMCRNSFGYVVYMYNSKAESTYNLLTSSEKEHVQFLICVFISMTLLFTTL